MSAATGCYTCLKEGRVARTVVREYEKGFVSFDLVGRAVYVYTPHRHVERIKDVSPEDLKEYHVEIGRFMREEGYRGYQVSTNHGTWVTHRWHHLHLKIAADEDEVMRRMRAHTGRS